MKILKILLLFFTVTAMANNSFAQLLERENIQSSIVTGTRPVAGNFGYYIGPSIVEIREIFDDELDVRGFPLMGFRYYLTDRFELRMSTQIYGTSEIIEGDLVNQIGEEDLIQKESFYRFAPSVQYHFASNNFLDTYAGLGVIVGTEIDEVANTQKVNLTGDFVSESYYQSTFDIGFNLNFGIQAFIADLPIAIAAEASIRSLKRYNLQYEATTRTSVGGVVNEQTFFTRDAEADLQYDALNYSEYEIGSDVRVLISYFFRR